MQERCKVAAILLCYISIYVDFGHCCVTCIFVF